ncbi:MAG: T9SS type A sorting domain-containing protein [Chitinophagales bacterium]|nr:T9SS type A sorting domain-containing protein [Chitinophagales bacterium]
MKKTLACFLVFCCLAECYSQSTISGNINPEKHLTNTEHNFTGFNSGQGYLESIYKNYASNSGLEVNNAFYSVFNTIGKRISWRFPGGTTANFYNRWGSGYGNTGFGQTFGDAWIFTNINWSILNSNYNKYANFSNKTYPFSGSNIIFPFINSITKNKTVTASSSFCLNMVSHYRSVPLINYDTRKETLKDTSKIKAIVDLDNGYLDAFNNSTLSTNFKKIVRQNIDAYLTLIKNGVAVYNIEYSNETFSYMYDDNLLSDYKSFVNNNNIFSPSDTKIWIRDDGSTQSIKEANSTFWTFARLSKLYRVLLTDTLQKLSSHADDINQPVFADHLAHLKFGMPIGAYLNGGFKTWNNFMINPEIKNYVGIDAYIIHPYLDSYNFIKNIPLSENTNASELDLTREFNDIRDTMEISYNKRFFKEAQVSLINALPANSEMWYTEWNFNFDCNSLKKVGNTMLHAMYYYDVVMNFYDINANRNLALECNKTNPVKLCNYHIPYAKSDTWYNMTRFTKGYNSIPSDPSTNNNSAANSVEFNSTYFAALLLTPILEDTAIYMIDNKNGGFDLLPNVSFRSFYKIAANQQYDIFIYFNNKSDADYSVDLMAVLNQKDTGKIKATASYLYADNLYSSMGQTTFRPDDIIYSDTSKNAQKTTIQKVYNAIIPGNNLSAVKIHKYSFGFIKISVNPAAAVPPVAARKKEESNTELVITEIAAPLIATEQPKIIPELKVYPNPNTTGRLSVDITVAADISSDLLVFDMTGNLVKSIPVTLTEGLNALETDLSELAKGTYILQINKQVSKVILQ